MSQLKIAGRRAGSRRGAFTMIEMLCVVIIMAIAAAIVFAGMSNQNDLKVSSAARTVLADLTYAQNYAIATQQPTYVTFNTGARTYSLCSSLSTPTYLINPITKTTYTNTFGSGILTNLSGCNFGTLSLGGQTAMYFDELGTPWSCTSTGGSPSVFSATGTVQVVAGKDSMTIDIQSNTGDMTVTVP
jgi:prepilin-type N-terminal cleavage/methylation domain-containing protein